MQAQQLFALETMEVFITSVVELGNENVLLFKIRICNASLQPIKVTYILE